MAARATVRRAGKTCFMTLANVILRIPDDAHPSRELSTGDGGRRDRHAQCTPGGRCSSRMAWRRCS